MEQIVDKIGLTHVHWDPRFAGVQPVLVLHNCCIILVCNLIFVGVVVIFWNWKTCGADCRQDRTDMFSLESALYQCVQPVLSRHGNDTGLA